VPAHSKQHWRSIQSILKRSKKNYEIEFDNAQWKIERARVESGEKELSPLEDPE